MLILCFLAHIQQVHIIPLHEQHLAVIFDREDHVRVSRLHLRYEYKGSGDDDGHRCRQEFPQQLLHYNLLRA